jgi:hypothetical protein
MGAVSAMDNSAYFFGLRQKLKVIKEEYCPVQAKIL